MASVKQQNERHFPCLIYSLLQLLARSFVSSPIVAQSWAHEFFACHETEIGELPCSSCLEQRADYGMRNR